MTLKPPATDTTASELGDDLRYLVALADWAAGQGFCQIDGLEDPEEWCARRWGEVGPPDGEGYSADALASRLSPSPDSGNARVLRERAVMVCPQCDGEGSYADGLDEAACTTDCTRCAGNGWIVDLAALASTAPVPTPTADLEAVREAAAKVAEDRGLERCAAAIRRIDPATITAASTASSEGEGK